MKYIKKVKSLLGGIKIYRNWPLWVLYHLNFIRDNKECLMKLRNGIKFYVRPDLYEVGTIDDVFLRNEYITANNIIKDKYVVIDIGANIGSFSILAAMKAPGIKVFSYEPVPSIFARLLKNIRVNRLETVIQPFNLAVAGERGERKLFLHPQISGANTLAPYRDNLEFVQVRNAIPVRALTLQDVFHTNHIEYCDFLKVDCEGAEFEVILNTPPGTLSKIKHIAIEYHRDPSELSSFLRGHGFSVETKPRDSTSGFIYADRPN